MILLIRHPMSAGASDPDSADLPRKHSFTIAALPTSFVRRGKLADELYEIVEVPEDEHRPERNLAF
jgi:hypothetical protein